MLDFRNRSSLPELMDDPLLPEKDLKFALNDIAIVNRWLGGNQITIAAVESLIKEFPHRKEWTIVDMGCGDGSMLRLLSTYFEKYDCAIKLIGLDLNPISISMAAKESQTFKNISFLSKDIMAIEEEEMPCDILLCTLTMHHFNDDEILRFLVKFRSLASVAIVINDLQRSKLAYHLFNLFSRIFMKSKIAKHDGKISIARSFQRDDLIGYSTQLNFQNYTIRWKWAFRYLWLIRTI